MSLKILFHKVVKVEIQVLEFSRWKFEVKHFDRSKLWPDRSKWKRKNPGVSRLFDLYLILVRSIEKSIQSIERTSQSIETRKVNFLQNFSSDSSKRLKRFQAFWTLLWNILTLYTCLLMKYNLMSINRGLCSLEK